MYFCCGRHEEFKGICNREDGVLGRTKTMRIDVNGRKVTVSNDRVKSVYLTMETHDNAATRQAHRIRQRNLHTNQAHRASPSRGPPVPVAAPPTGAIQR
jgi:tricorn protease-like protein